MTTIELILTHPGGAHKDEFLACAVLLALHPVPIIRREPTAEDLARAHTAVVDVGLLHQPELNNFDHHQLHRDLPPTCSLSLVLQHLGIYDDARQFCEWLETTEWFDCRGPETTARWLGIQRDVLSRLNSPIDISLLRRFSSAQRLESEDPLWEMMRMIGEDLLAYVRSLRARLDFIETHAEVWDFGGPTGRVVFMPRTDPLPDEPSSGLDQFVERRGLTEQVMGLVYPDRRGSGYGLSRFRDHPRLDFTRVAGLPEVHFAHARGFIAKTSVSDPDQLKKLLQLACTPTSPEKASGDAALP